MSYVIPRNPQVLMDHDPDGASAVIDLSCYVSAIDISSESAEVDVATFCNPSATAPGKVTDSAVFSILWSKDMYDAMKPHKDKEVLFSVKYDETDTEAIEFRGKYATLPWGYITPGERVEDDLSVAVLTSPDYVTPTITIP